MKAIIKTYQTNATLTVGDQFFTIDWDGMEFHTRDEYKEWIDEEMTPASECENYNEVRLSLEIATDYLRPNEEKNYIVIYSPTEDSMDDRYVGSVSDYISGGFCDPIYMTKEQAEELVAELDNYVRNEEDFGANREQALYAYEKKEWGFVMVED